VIFVTQQRQLRSLFEKISTIAVWIVLFVFLWIGIAIAETGTIAIDNLKIRSVPSTSGAVMGTLRKGELINIVGKKGDCWYEIRYKNKKAYVYGCSGYVVMGAAGETSSKEIQEVRNQAKTISGQLSKAKERFVQIAQEEKNTTRDMNAIDKEISRLGTEENKLQNQLMDLNQEIQTNVGKLEQVQAEIRMISEAQNRRLIALYKMGRLGRAQLLGSAASMNEAIKMDVALRRILENDKEQLQKLDENAHRQKVLLEKLSDQKEECIRIEKKIEEKKIQSAGKRKEREKTLVQIRKEKKLQEQTMRQLQAAASNLDRTIRDLQAKELERKRREAEAAEKAGTPTTTKKEPASTTLPPSTQTTTGFASTKGTLPMPARGNITLPFGTYRDDTLKVSGTSKGIGIRVNIGDPVRAVYQGRVAYAGWLKGYGNMLIIDHGDHYYTVYAHAQDLFKKRGDSVSAGEQIASAGDSGSVFGPQLYFEIRYYDRPENPMLWLRR